MDTFDAITRSRIMASVHSKDTAQELILRKALFARGLRYRLHVSKLPGTPDLVFPRHHAVIFVHGCLWHWHGCPRSRMPSTNIEYWKGKISRNQKRDKAQVAALLQLGWRVLIVWECALKARSLNAVADMANAWLRDSSDILYGVIEPKRGTDTHQPPRLVCKSQQATD